MTDEELKTLVASLAIAQQQTSEKMDRTEALASFHIHDDAKKEALKRGYFVLQRSGNVIHSECGKHLKVL